MVVSGKSGTGKSTLVERAFQTEQESCLFCSGKFENSARETSPFATLIGCFSELSHAMAKSSSRLDYRTSLTDVLEARGISILTKMVPSIADLMGPVTEDSDDGSLQQKLHSSQNKNDLEQLKFVLRQFLVTVSQRKRPVVMFLDDLQWMDLPSFQLIESLLNN